MFGAIGLVVMHLVARHGLATIRGADAAAPRRLALPACVAVLGVGTTVNGASRWIGAGFLQIQPSELAKVALILYAADLLAARAEAGRSSIEG